MREGSGGQKGHKGNGNLAGQRIERKKLNSVNGLPTECSLGDVLSKGTSRFPDDSNSDAETPRTKG
jgi:hypothetical protein